MTLTSQPSREPPSMSNSSPPPGHLSPELLAGYIDRSLATPVRASVDAHLADCAQCRAELVAVKQLVHAAPTARPMRGLTVAVAGLAATILVAVLLRPTESPQSLRSPPSAAPAEANALIAVAPSAASRVVPADIRFVWRRSTDVVEYTITVLDAEGGALWKASTSDTSVALPDSVALEPGSTIYWYVDGLRADGRAVGTGRQQVTVR